MKKIIAVFVFTNFIFFAHAQVGKIPAEVTDAFAKKYPDAQHVQWKDRLQFFEADFQNGNADLSADFSRSGDWQNSAETITFESLPEAVKDGFKKSKYSTDWQVKNVYEVQQADKPLEYKLSVYKNDIQKKNLFFDADGKLLKEAITL